MDADERGAAEHFQRDEAVRAAPGPMSSAVAAAGSRTSRAEVVIAAFA
ncbi:hypothetical protein [Streptomyces sp. NPDC101181]